MSDKDINIHVKAQDTEASKQKVDKFSESLKKVQENTDSAGKSAQDFGKKTTEGQEQAGNATEKASHKFSLQDKLIGGLKNQLTGFVVASLGLAGISKLADVLIARFEKMSQIMREVYDRGLSLLNVGQRLEFQTGTKGQQTQWAIAAANLQQTGGLQNIETAQQMMISGDIAFAGQGGIKNPQIMKMLQQLAPFVGTAQLGSEEITKLFEFAGAAGIEPDTKAYKDYFAKLQAGFTASKATSFGQFMTGLQTGATGYLAQGGSLEEAIAAFSSARSVSANEALAASLLEQVTRLSGGGYEKPRKDIERVMKVKWQDISMDQRLSVLLDYVGKIPDSMRTQKLSAVGFPVELSGQLGKIVSDEAKKTMQATRQSVNASSSQNIDEMSDAYLKSSLGQAKSTEGSIAGQTLSKTDKISPWENRLKLAKAAADLAIMEGKDSKLVANEFEYLDLAYKEMQNEIQLLLEQNPDSKDLKQQLNYILDTRALLRIPGFGIGLRKKIAAPLEAEGNSNELRLNEIKQSLQSAPAGQTQGPVIINNTSDNSLNIYPAIGQFEPQRVDFNE